MTPASQAAAPSPVPQPDEEIGAWTAVKDAIRGTSHDYTQGSIGRSIFLLAIPMVLEMVMESIFAVVDVFFVAKLGADAVATVGLTESLLAIVYALAMGLGIGAMAMVARRIGEKDPEGASRAAVQAIALGLILAAIVGVIGAVFAPSLLGLMGASPGVIEQGSGFARVMLGGNVTVLMIFMLNAIFRGAGDAAIAMRVLWLANAINIGLGPLLIFGIGPFPELGVTGAAIATNIGRGTGALYALSRMLRPGSRVTIRRQHLQLDWTLMWRIVKLSASATLQMIIGMVSWVALIRIISRFGSAALAGYTIGIRIIIFALLPSWGMSNAAATMVGQALGSGQPERAERAVWKAAFYNVVFLGGIGLLFVLFAEPLIGLFTQDPAVVPYGVQCLRLVALGFLFYAYGMVLTQAFNGAGDTWTPTVINLFVFWLFQIPLAWILAMEMEMGPSGVFLSITISYSVLAVVSAILFRRGRWKARTV